MFLFARALPLVRILVILDPYFGGVRAQKPPKKGHFMDAASVWKTLKILNLTTTNAILMKLITVIYLHENVNRKAFRAREAWQKSLMKMGHKIVFLLYFQHLLCHFKIVTYVMFYTQFGL